MIEVNIDTSDLLKWSAYFGRIPTMTRAALARALNTYGGQVAVSTSQYIAQQSGLDQDDVQNMLVIKPASPDDLDWEMDASAIAPPSLDWSRPWDTRDSGTTDAFNQSTLVKLVTMCDDKVCEICERISNEGPYALQDLATLRVSGYDGGNGLIHWNCRCQLAPWTSSRPLPVTFGAGPNAPTQLFSARQLGRAVAGELEVALRGGGSGSVVLSAGNTMELPRWSSQGFDYNPMPEEGLWFWGE